MTTADVADDPSQPEVRSEIGIRSVGPDKDSKALRLARYLKEFVGLRSTTIVDVSKYESVLWFHDLPQEPDCQSPAWNSEASKDGAWLIVRKQQFTKPPEPPDQVLPWIEQQRLKRATEEPPPLKEKIFLPDPNTRVEEDEEPPLVAHDLVDHPDIRAAYETFKPTWLAWATEYRRKQRIQQAYADLFHLHTQMRKQGEIVEIVLGLGLLDWKPNQGAGVRVRRHVVTARVDLKFDPASGVIRLSSGDNGAQLKIEDEMLDAQFRPERGHHDSVTEQLAEIGDDIWDRPRLDAALKSWAGGLHADTKWWPELRPLSEPSDRPIISFAPALIMRRRTQAGMVRIYEAMIERLNENGTEVPVGWSSLIEDIDDVEHDALDTTRSASENSRAAPTAENQEIYFPLPANREQRRIVEAINERRGVLVQGPPGTGKSHTIANLMCHLLATGKRVLITAETGRALQVLKEKLPKELQPLCVSLLGHGGDSFAELNGAVQGITTRHASYTPGQYQTRIAEIDEELDLARRKLAKIDGELRQLRANEADPHTIANGSYSGTASEIAARVAVERTKYGWLKLPHDAESLPPLPAIDLEVWLKTCRTYDAWTVEDSRLRLAEEAALLTPNDFGLSVQNEAEAKLAIDSLAELRAHHAYASILSRSADQKAQLAEAIRGLEEKRRQLSRYREVRWIDAVISAALAGRQAVWRTLHERSSSLARDVERLLDRTVRHSVTIPPTRDLRAVRNDAAAMIEHLRVHEKWPAFDFMASKKIKGKLYLRDEVQVDSQPPLTIDQLQVICDQIQLDASLSDLENAWSEYGGLPKGTDLKLRLAGIHEQIDILGRALEYAESCTDLGRALESHSPPIPEPKWLDDDAKFYLAIVEASAIEQKYVLAAQWVTASLGALKVIRRLHDAHPVVGALVDAIEQRDVSAYSLAYATQAKVQKVKADLSHQKVVEASLQKYVPGLVEMVTLSASEDMWDRNFKQWSEAWNWALTDSWLERRGDADYVEGLKAARRDADGMISQLISETAALRAWTHFFARLTPNEASSLKGWRETIRAIGKGTGRSSKTERLRREARRYMDQCREAIPVWIMPRYLVAEMVDAIPNRYDLVIVDEASQLGIESLFLFYIARKLVVVGDDQQISPSGIGIADQDIDSLQHHYLGGIPHKPALSAQSSLYANAKIRFGQNIVLREHFRCMPEIIQFSNDLCYASNGTPLDPLRTYPSNRLKPTVLRHVADGYRTGSVQNALNEPEADAIVAQIHACLADPQYEGLSMGVISLQGEAQAKLIERKLLEVVDPRVIEQRRIICGDAYAFQGDERRVIFLSMVAAPNERIGVLAAESARQRFNVAASRAQDQLWLFHSATLDMLSPACMRHRLLTYMTNPTRAVADEEGQRFDSQFERDVFTHISSRGYHVRTQVCVGDPTNHRYRIDLVVEGMRGRLAVECDGDRWHGPDRYDQDMARQRDLERAGWQFMRISGGAFYRNPAKTMAPLWAELERLGILPGMMGEVEAEPPKPTNASSVEISTLTDDEPSESDQGDYVPSDEGGGRTSEEPLNAEEAADSIETRSPGDLFAQPEAASALPAGSSTREPPEVPVDRFQLPYIEFVGVAGEDPRIVSVDAVAEGLLRIIEVEGPIVAKRAFDVYLRGCGIRRLGSGIKSSMNRALASLVRQGKVLTEDESGKGGLLFTVVRLVGREPVVLRTRGSREFDEIPPSELHVLGRFIASRDQIASGSDLHLRSVLEFFELKRLTTQVGTTLLEAMERKYPYAEEALKKLWSAH
jgi:very-short-patch-repair endonuclease